MKFQTSIFIGVILIFAQIGCKKDPPIVPPVEPPPYQQSIFLAIADSGLTEVYLSLSMTDTLPPRGFEVFRNNNKILSGSLFGKETTLVDTTAILNTSYIYQAFRVDNAMRTDSSAFVATSTLDTTSHEFVWQVFTLGDGNASIINDAVIIDKNNIWVVGDINIFDSTGQDYEKYGAAQWDGIKWNLKKICYVSTEGDTFVVAPIRGILYLSPNNIWFAAGSVFQWEGESTFAKLVYSRLQGPEPFPFYVKLWGASDKEIYFVGYNGSLLHYNGDTWQKIETGTTLDISDVHGDYNNETKEYEIIAVAAKQFENQKRKVLKINRRAVSFLPDSGLVGPQSGIWHKAGKKYLVAGNGIYIKKNILDETPWERLFRSVTTLFYTNDVDGNNVNDVVVCGSSGELMHFNGSKWKSFRTIIPSNVNNEYERITIKKNVVVATGWYFSKGIVALGKRFQ